VDIHGAGTCVCISAGAERTSLPPSLSSPIMPGGEKIGFRRGETRDGACVPQKPTLSPAGYLDTPSPSSGSDQPSRSDSSERDSPGGRGRLIAPLPPHEGEKPRVTRPRIEDAL
jgi:hypothetical protein